MADPVLTPQIIAAMERSPIPVCPPDCDLADWIDYAMAQWRSERVEAQHLASLVQDAHDVLDAAGAPHFGTPAGRLQAVVEERDQARAEVARLTRERDEARRMLGEVSIGSRPPIALRLEAHRDYDAVDVLSRVQRALEAAGFRLRDLGDGRDSARVAVVTPPRRFVDPTPEPDPRDSAGATADEGGGPEVGGDCDHDGDVPEVAHRSGGRGYFGEPPADTRQWAVAYPGGIWRVLRWFHYRGAADLACDDFLGARTIRLYWPADCDGGDDPPRDCLPG